MRYTTPTPYRAIVFTTYQRITGKGKRQRITTQGAAYVLWNAETTCEPWRDGYGSFLWPGLHAVRRAVMQAFEADTNAHQAVVRTNQDKDVYRFYRGNSVAEED